jgi:hypothetical protein
VSCTSYKYEEILEKSIDWIRVVYLNILNNELEAFKLEAVLHGADYEKMKELKINFEPKKEQVATIKELMNLGLVKGKYKGQRKGKVK